MRPAKKTYGLCNIVDNDGAVCVAVIHGGQGFVTLLSGSIPNLELDCGVLIEGDGLCQECGADGGLPERVKLVLETGSAE